MSKYLIVYGTKEGQTEKIAQFIGDIITHQGHQADLYNARTLPNHFLLDGYTGIIVGSSVHMGYWSTETRQFIRKYHQELENIPSAFFSVSMAAASQDPSAATRLDRQVQGYLESTGWHPTKKVHFAGCLAYTKYGFFTRAMMKGIAKSTHESTDTSADHEYTDWDKVTEFVKDFMAETADAELRLCRQED